MSADLANEIIEEFRTIYPFIQVKYWRASGEELAPKLENVGAVFPASGTEQSELLENVNLITRTEDVVLKAMELGLRGKYADVLGVAK